MANLGANVVANAPQGEAAPVNNQPRPLKDYFAPIDEETPSPLVFPPITAHTFELKSNLIQWVSSVCSFHGNLHEDPNDHLRSFLRLCDTFKINGLTDDDIRLRLFPFTLQDKAQAWLNTLPRNSITSWSGLRQAFLSKFFPPSKASHFRTTIMTFQQQGSESLHEAWERFQDLLRRCPQHGITDHIQLGIFYGGLSQPTRAILDASAGGSFMNKDVTSATLLLDDMATNHYKWQADERGVVPKKAGIYEVDDATRVQAQLESLGYKLSKLEESLSRTVQAKTICEICDGEHTFSSCPQRVEAIQNFRQGNQGGFNHYNNWRPQQGQWSNEQRGYQPRPYYPSGFNGLSQGEEEDLRAMMKTLMASHRNLEVQVGQLARQVNERPRGQLPSDTTDPRSGDQGPVPPGN